MQLEHLKLRIDSAQDAIRRTRTAFLISILASGAMMFCLWNTYLGWDRDFAFLTTLEQEEVTAPSLLANQMKSWIDTQVVSINLLGIRISVSDFAILGSLTLGLCCYYLLLCSRRENHEVGYLFRDLIKESGGSRKRDELSYNTYRAISGTMVFNLVGSERKDDVTQGTPEDEIITSIYNEPDRSELRAIRRVGWLLHYLPFFVICLTIVCDFGWFFWDRPILPHGTTLRNLVGTKVFASAFRPPRPEHFEFPDVIYFIVAETFAALMAFVVFRSSKDGLSYSRGTRAVLVEFFTHLTAQGEKGNTASA
jgi:hypothetical protein